MTRTDDRDRPGGSIRWGAAATLLILTFTGAAVGYFAHARVFGNSTAVSVLAIGTVASEPVADPVELIERVESPQFAAIVAQRSGLPEAKDLLPRSGKGDLKARILRSRLLVELRVSAQSSHLALKLSRAVNDEVIAEHKKISEPFRRLLDERINRLKKLAHILANAAEQIPRSSTAGSADASGAPDKDQLRTAFIELINRERAEVSPYKAEVSARPPYTQPTRVISGPAIIPTLLSSPYRTAALGAVAGFLIGLLFMQSRRLIIT